MKGTERESAGVHLAAGYYHQRFIKTQVASVPEAFWFFLRLLFYVDHFLKVFIEVVLQHCFGFMFWLFGHETCGIDPAPWPSTAKP